MKNGSMSVQENHVVVSQVVEVVVNTRIVVLKNVLIVGRLELPVHLAKERLEVDVVEKDVLLKKELHNRCS